MPIAAIERRGHRFYATAMLVPGEAIGLLGTRAQTRKPPRVLLIVGSDDVTEARDSGVIRSPGNNDSRRMLKMLEPLVTVQVARIAPNYFRQPHRILFRGHDLVWNAISDQDQNPRCLSVLKEVLSKVTLPVINSPHLIRRGSREVLPTTLAGLDDVHCPQTVLIKNPTRHRVQNLIDEAGLAFPAILRRAGTHSGQVMGLVQGINDLEPIFGDREGRYYLTQFVDVRLADGLYRKTRFYYVGDQIITRQHIVGRDWNIHGRNSRDFMVAHEPLLAESRAMLIDGFESLPDRTRIALKRLGERMGLDYFGLDCTLMPDGRIVVFECNATMNFNPAFANPHTQHNRAALPRMLEAMHRLIQSRTSAPAITRA